jgi:hypothetical protein
MSLRMEALLARGACSLPARGACPEATQLELCPWELEVPLEMPLELEPASSEPSLLLELHALELELELGLGLGLGLEPPFWKLSAWASCSIRERLVASSRCLASSLSRESLIAAWSSRCSWASCSGEGGAMVFRVAALGVLLHQTRRMIQHERGQALRRWRSRYCPWCELHPQLHPGFVSGVPR